jgi:probable phosphoglycerate mutase
MTVQVCLVRHALTSWNEEGRIQGRHDIPLSPAGVAQVAGWHLPTGFADARCRVSPLSRARQTAVLLGMRDAEVDPRLAEMSWGAFEGSRIDELRARHGKAFRGIERMGLDFRPPCGETPREVADRVQGCLRDVARTSMDHVLVAHKGILRAALVLVTDWNMRTPSPIVYDPERALILSLNELGMPSFCSSLPLRAGVP